MSRNNKDLGTNLQHIKARNRLLILRLIATTDRITRIDISSITGLSRMTIGNCVSELITNNYVEELKANSTAGQGRKPSFLAISKDSPCICGMLIKRGVCQICLSNLDGTIIEKIDHPYEHLASSQELVDILVKDFKVIQASTHKQILAVGISCVGPLDTQRGVILNPPYFYGIEDLPIVSLLEKELGLNVYLINDANAGALAEKFYGIGKNIPNFIYVHIMNGIGAGMVLNDVLFNGNTGQSGELGHTSISFSGPQCACGNSGCLELYANISTIRQHIQEQSSFHPKSPLLKARELTWAQIINNGDAGDPLALSALNQFCSYISYALIDTLNLLDLSTVIVGYESNENCNVIERLLQAKLENTVLSSKTSNISVLHSYFCGNAPLIGSIALIANKYFMRQMELPDINEDT